MGHPTCWPVSESCHCSSNNKFSVQPHFTINEFTKLIGIDLRSIRWDSVTRSEVTTVMTMPALDWTLTCLTTSGPVSVPALLVRVSRRWQPRMDWAGHVSILRTAWSWKIEPGRHLDNHPPTEPPQMVCQCHYLRIHCTWSRTFIAYPSHLISSHYIINLIVPCTLFTTQLDFFKIAECDNMLL